MAAAVGMAVWTTACSLANETITPAPPSAPRSAAREAKKSNPASFDAKAYLAGLSAESRQRG
ncbi:MAG: hypothetical protein JWO88_3802, partial [Frankiales bacterium]|nr:hypothetical protein [Frankiales bacterium]